MPRSVGRQEPIESLNVDFAGEMRTGIPCVSSPAVSAKMRRAR
jgi:hypothetical protein